MLINKIGITKIINPEELSYRTRQAFDMLNCTEIRERTLKNGSKVLVGYQKNSPLACYIQKITKEGYLKTEKFFSKSNYGLKNENTEIEICKTTFNKIGDKLKEHFIVRTYENKKLTERLETFLDLFKGIDKSEKTQYTGKTNRIKSKLIKERISDVEYVETLYQKDKLVYKETKNNVDLDGNWKF